VTPSRPVNRGSPVAPYLSSLGLICLFTIQLSLLVGKLLKTFLFACGVELAPLNALTYLLNQKCVLCVVVIDVAVNAIFSHRIHRLFQSTDLLLFTAYLNLYLYVVFCILAICVC